MSATREVTIWCDTTDCYEWAQSEPSMHVTQTRDALKASGWTREFGGSDYCPSCSRDRKTRMTRRE